MDASRATSRRHVDSAGSENINILWEKYVIKSLHVLLVQPINMITSAW